MKCPHDVVAAISSQTHSGGVADSPSSTGPLPDNAIIDNSSALSRSLRGYLSSADEYACNHSTVFSNQSYSEIDSFYDLLFNHSHMRMREDILRYMTPVVIIIGDLSNLLALFVLRRKKLRRYSVCFYMSAYAIANLFILNVMFGISWICFTFNKRYVTNLADWSCKLWSFITNVITFSGIWFVVAMSIDRLLYTTSRSSSVFSAKATVTAIMTGLVVVSIHAMWTYELQPQGCYIPFQQEDAHIIIWPWWSATVYTYLPLFLIFILNIVHPVALCITHARGTNSSHQDPTADSFVLTVIVVSVSFFLLTVPATVTNILDIHLPSSWINVDLVARLELTKKITELLSSLNYVLFGVQLLLCSGEFRREFVALLRAVFCCLALKRRFKVFELRHTSNSEDSSPHRQVDYELCNNNDDTITSV